MTGRVYDRTLSQQALLGPRRPRPHKIWRKKFIKVLVVGDSGLGKVRAGGGGGRVSVQLTRQQQATQAACRLHLHGNSKQDTQCARHMPPQLALQHAGSPAA